MTHDEISHLIEAALHVTSEQSAVERAGGPVGLPAAKRVAAALARLVVPILLYKNSIIEKCSLYADARPESLSDIPRPDPVAEMHVYHCGRLCEIFPDSLPLDVISSDKSYNHAAGRSRRVYELVTSLRDSWAEQIRTDSHKKLGACETVLSQWNVAVTQRQPPQPGGKTRNPPKPSAKEKKLYAEYQRKPLDMGRKGFANSERVSEQHLKHVIQKVRAYGRFRPLR